VVFRYQLIRSLWIVDPSPYLVGDEGAEKLVGLPIEIDVGEICQPLGETRPIVQVLPKSQTLSNISRSLQWKVVKLPLFRGLLLSFSGP
jgi:hypothetical protein